VRSSIARDVVSAGDRFAHRVVPRDEAPAASEANLEASGLEMVIVCGHNMGDISAATRPNLGLPVVQARKPVADARPTATAFSLEPRRAG